MNRSPYHETGELDKVDMVVSLTFCGGTATLSSFEPSNRARGDYWILWEEEENGGGVGRRYLKGWDGGSGGKEVGEGVDVAANETPERGEQRPPPLGRARQDGNRLNGVMCEKRKSARSIVEAGSQGGEWE